MKKYPRTFHFKFSEEIHSDDKTINDIYLSNFIENEIIITEKLDGGNCCLKPNIGVFARSHILPTDCPTFDYIKNEHYFKKIHLLNPDFYYFGENMYAIHSIKYDNLNDYLYIFNIYDNKNKIWLSIDEIKKECNRCNFKIVPILFKGKMTIKEIKQFCKTNIKLKSSFGKNSEGFVIRISKSFKNEDFDKYIAKFVRKNHVQSDKHWKYNWKKQKLIIT